jgi:hypothetical protein
MESYIDADGDYIDEDGDPDYEAYCRGSAEHTAAAIGRPDLAESIAALGLWHLDRSRFSPDLIRTIESIHTLHDDEPREHIDAVWRQARQAADNAFGTVPSEPAPDFPLFNRALNAQIAARRRGPA